ncbi:MAG: hypothetical protein GKR94_12150 [Gammaproteobacteria bacterium]|nr:hypothetical protein [Gammaproteobacteria bacterium]
MTRFQPTSTTANSRVATNEHGKSEPLVEVSDHAVVRYLERVKGVDVGSVRAEIAERIKNPRKYAGFLGDATARVHSDGTVFVITAYPARKMKKQAHPTKKKSKTKALGVEELLIRKKITRH